MGIINPDRPHTLFGVNSLCCCLAPMRVNLTRWCRPSLECMRHPCLYCRMTILPVKSFKKVKVRNLKRIEPKEDDDDGELQDTKDEEGDGTEAPVSKFSGKKKGIVKKGGTNNALSAFGLLGEGDDEDNEDSGITKRILMKKNQDNEVAGFAPNEKQITELKVGKDKRALKVAKRKLGTHKRAKKREEMTFVLQKMRAAGGGEKKK